MKKLTFIFAAFLLLTSFRPEGVKVGEKATDFKLKNIDGKMVALNDFKSSKGVILVFTCNHCPFAKKYESRIVALDKKYKSLGYPVVAINPNDPAIEPEDSYDNMQKRAKEKGFSFPYLVDESQAITRAYGATKTPHVFILQNTKDGSVVKYIGAIDDNSDDESAVKEKYVQSAVDALLSGKEVSTTSTKAVGCGIKWKKA